MYNSLLTMLSSHSLLTWVRRACVIARESPNLSERNWLLDLDDLGEAKPETAIVNFVKGSALHHLTAAPYSNLAERAD